ncbi:MAG: radical SAM protein [Promethearchaeota archaeon]
MNIESESRSALARKVRELFKKVKKGKGSYVLCENEEYLLVGIEHAVEERVLAGIRARQEALTDGGSTKLRVTAHGYRAVWGGELTPGCRACLDCANSVPIRSVSKCNLQCKFCYYYGEPVEDMPDDMYKLGNLLFTEDDLKLVFDKQGAAVSAVSWVYYEPFVQFEKHPGLVKYISDMGIPQWMYTNGTLCTEEQLKELADAGLEELRFNLAATMCSKKVLETMAFAREHFEYLCVESPMFGEFFDAFVKNKDDILATGVDHINCAELHLEGRNRANFSSEGPVYRYKREYVSPVKSRHYTYDLIELAEREGWEGVMINDCSNQLKFYRGIHAPEVMDTFGDNSWFSHKRVYLEEDWYLDALERYDIGCAE